MRVLDTTVAIDHLRDRPEASDLVGELVRSTEELVASEVVRFEILAGTRREEVDRTERLFSVVTWVPVTEDVARDAGTLARNYRHSHSGIGDADYLIAATTVVLDAELLTTNVRHFPMFEGLRPPY